MIALISDLHANMPAIEAVFDDIDSIGDVERIYCLGDVIGYGPQPVEALELTARRCSLILMGNHEAAVVGGAFGFRDYARRAIDWTREELKRGFDSTRFRRMWDLLKNLPHRHEFGDCLVVHGSPRDPVMEYVLESDLWEGADPTKMDQIFEGFERVCFVGHTHRPGVFTEDRCFLPSQELADGFDLGDGAKYLVNVGSVGQPRDGDPRACYTLFTGDAIYFRRVEYDVAATAEMVRANPELGDRLANRLYKGE
jgi:diadenosine tetraphosphatase ApaH/serine/threonine PP2A family protein phosphatase